MSHYCKMTKRFNIDLDRLKYVVEDRCEFRKAIALLVDQTNNNKNDKNIAESIYPVQIST